MQIEKIRALAALMNETGLQELHLEEEGSKIALKRPQMGASTDIAAQSAMAQIASTTLEAPAAPILDTSGTTVVSPMVGVFYSSPSSSEPPFVSVGKAVKAGDVLCIIEAMKLMNEITAETDGIITEIFPHNGQMVEYDQPLFKMGRGV
ncbi:MAG: acetyl-CoA carboxylase biotin carboxyl carrier protein [Defluviitaleaceae bacterium]|nr:acetyl-CoA carboxylase biotin carboxyl carrier protein [Defluviitaleaceae bacterium]